MARKTNCLTETFFEQAEKRARYLDDLRVKGGPLGPLHGLPVSLKDSYQVEGTEACIGAVAFMGRISTENSALVDLLLDLGAVLYVKTNVPQVLMVRCVLVAVPQYPLLRDTYTPPLGRRDGQQRIWADAEPLEHESYSRRIQRRRRRSGCISRFASWGGHRSRR